VFAATAAQSIVTVPAEGASKVSVPTRVSVTTDTLTCCRYGGGSALAYVALMVIVRRLIPMSRSEQ
jgi:hypothetical protein